MIKVYQSKLPKYAGHTAGPWKQSEMTPVRVDTKSGSISVNWTCNFDGGQTFSEARANAALIADAPFLACEVERLQELCGELMGALEYIRANCFIYCDSSMDIDSYACEIADKAIAKAKGGDE